MDRERPVTSDLTSPAYWQARQKNQLKETSLLTDDSESEWLKPCLPFLRAREGQHYLELGCSPGHASAQIAARVALVMEGIDYNPESHLFVDHLRAVGNTTARVHQGDIRTFQAKEPFDIVASYGLIEHFDDPRPILAEHDRLLRPGGLCIIVIPHFRWLQYAYHYLFDRDDLARHNTRTMTLATFRAFAHQQGYTINHLGFAGPMRFWGYVPGSNPILQAFQWLSIRMIGRLAPFLRRRFRRPCFLYSPWIVFIATKNPGQA